MFANLAFALLAAVAPVEGDVEETQEEIVFFDEASEELLYDEGQEIAFEDMINDESSNEIVFDTVEE